MQEMTECKNEILSLKSIVREIIYLFLRKKNIILQVLSENRMTRQSSSNMNNRSLNISSTSTSGDLSTPVRNKKQVQSTIVKKDINTPPRSQSVTTTRVLLKNVKSSGYGQQSPAFATPGRTFRK
jgi:hypothetical protein